MPNERIKSDHIKSVTDPSQAIFVMYSRQRQLLRYENVSPEFHICCFKWLDTPSRGAIPFIMHYGKYFLRAP
jgi:hypothetical protein